MYKKRIVDLRKYQLPHYHKIHTTTEHRKNTNNKYTKYQYKHIESSEYI